MPATTQPSDITLNWILFNSLRARIKDDYILIPRASFEGPSKDCRQRFVKPLREEFDVALQAKDIKFWKAGGTFVRSLR
jgi:hypothetical protein